MSKQLPARCGDGVVYEGVEACDDGNGAQTDACLTSCSRHAAAMVVVRGRRGLR